MVILRASVRLPPREWPRNSSSLVVPGVSVDTVLSREQLNLSNSNNLSLSLLIKEGNFSISNSLESVVIAFDYLSIDVLTANIINRFFLDTSNSNSSSFVLTL